MSLTLSAQTREKTGKQAKSIRKEGLVPAVIYGTKTENLNIQINQRELQVVLKAAGTTGIIEINIEGGNTVEALARDVIRTLNQQHFVHVDFFAPDLTQPVRSNVPLKIIGETKLIVAGGILVTPIGQVTVSALPKELPSELTIDISTLQEFSDVVTAGSVELPAGVEMVSKAGTALAYVAETRATRAAAAAEREA